MNRMQMYKDIVFRQVVCTLHVSTRLEYYIQTGRQIPPLHTNLYD